MNYHIARKGQQLGVFTAEAVARKLATGDLDGGDLAWTEGMADWQPIASIDEIAAAVAAAPSGPPKPPELDHPGTGALGEPRSAAELATPTQRLVAALLDGLVNLPALLPLLVVFAKRSSDDASLDFTSTEIAWIGVAVIWILIVTVINLVLLTRCGQTLGKKWTGIRIARIEDNGNPGFVKAVLLRGFVNGAIGSVPMIGPVYSIVDLCFIFRDDRRCIHDHLAGTRVVKV